MKYTLHGFSQKNAIDLGLDDRDLMILRWFIDYKDSGKMVTRIIDNTMYYWIKYAGIQEAFPITSWKKDTVYRRLKKLVDCGILKSQVIKEEGTWNYYCIGDKYIELIDSNHSSNDYTGLDNKSEGVGNKSEGVGNKSEGVGNKSEGVGNKSEGSLGNKSDQYSSINNLYSSNNINKENIKEKKSDEEIIKKIVKIYPGTKTKSVRDKKLPKIIKEHGAEEILEAVTRYAKTVEGKEKQFILNESTFWNGRYIDYLTENYEEEPKVGGTSRKYKVNVEDKSKKEAGKFNNFEPRKYSDADYKYLEERCCPAIKEEDYEVKDEDVCFGGFNLNEIENTY